MHHASTPSVAPLQPHEPGFPDLLHEPKIHVGREHTHKEHRDSSEDITTQLRTHVLDSMCKIDMVQLCRVLGMN